MTKLKISIDDISIEENKLIIRTSRFKYIFNNPKIAPTDF